MDKFAGQRRSLSIFLGFILLLSACEPQTPDVTLEVITQGQEVVSEQVSVLVEHCNIDMQGPVEKTVERSFWNEGSIEWAWGTQYGVGAHVDAGIGIIDGGVEIGAALSRTYAAQRNVGEGESVAINLLAYKDQRMEYVVEWVITKEIGVIEIGGARKPTRIGYKWPSNIDGRIISGNRYECDSLPPEPTAIPTVVVVAAPEPEDNYVTPASQAMITGAAPENKSATVPERLPRVYPSTTLRLGGRQLSAPEYLAVDQDGNIYVFDRELHEVLIFRSTGGFVGAIAIRSEVQDIAVGNSNLVVGTINELIYYDLTGTYQRLMAIRPEWQVAHGYDLEISRSGYVFLGDRTNKQILALNYDGMLLQVWDYDVVDLAVFDDQHIWGVSSSGTIATFSLADDPLIFLPGPAALIQSDQEDLLAVFDHQNNTVRYYHMGATKWSLIAEYHLRGSVEVADLALSHGNQAVFLDKHRNELVTVEISED